MEEIRKCRYCHEGKSIDQFSLTWNGYLTWKCKPCQAQYARDYRAKNRERKRAVDREHYHQNKDMHRNSYLQRTYGISLEDYNLHLAEQGGLCKICGNPPSGKGIGGRLHVDHDHVTGAYRALLCNNCNLGLGNLQDSAELLRKAADYLDSFAGRCE